MVFILTGCSSYNPSPEGEINIIFNDNYDGSLQYKFIDSNRFNPIRSSSTGIINLPQSNPLTFDYLEFRESEISNFGFKLEICTTNQFGENYCDLKQYKIIRNDQNIQFIPDTCEDCYSDLNILKDVIWVAE